jgi:hypothetical protein
VMAKASPAAAARLTTRKRVAEYMLAAWPAPSRRAKLLSQRLVEWYLNVC